MKISAKGIPLILIILDLNAGIVTEYLYVVDVLNSS